jgi:hypothetical protein
MKNSEIKALTPSRARSLSESEHRWRAVWYGRVKHFFVRLAPARGWGDQRGRTMCGQDLPEYPRGDIKHVIVKRRCAMCVRKFALLQQRAQEES